MLQVWLMKVQPRYGHSDCSRMDTGPNKPLLAPLVLLLVLQKKKNMQGDHLDRDAQGAPEVRVFTDQAPGG